jgi:hypothetical protein
MLAKCLHALVGTRQHVTRTMLCCTWPPSLSRADQTQHGSTAGAVRPAAGARRPRVGGAPGDGTPGRHLRQDGAPPLVTNIASHHPAVAHASTAGWVRNAIMLPKAGGVADVGRCMCRSTPGRSTAGTHCHTVQCCFAASTARGSCSELKHQWVWWKGWTSGGKQPDIMLS